MYIFIDTEQKLSEALSLMRQQPQIAFDLEFDRDRHTYGFDLCLMQIGFGETCLIIDPMTIEDVKPVFDVFEDPSIQKLVHCPGEDLRLLHSLGCYPKNIADTEVMAKLMNYEHTSLAKLLENKLGVMLNKKQQQSNWHHRPLKDEQLTYAADDVLYLPELFSILKEEVASKGLLAWVEEEFNWLQTVKYTLEQKTNFLKAGDLKSLSQWQQFVLNEVFKTRDNIARIKNKPAFMIMPEQTVRDIALGYLPYHNTQSLPGLHPSLKHGQAAKEFRENIERIFETADLNKLEKKSNGKLYTDEEQKEYRKKKDMQYNLKDNFFGPVQQTLTREFGAFASRYILSNGWITKWLNGEVKWKDLQPGYKQKLIEEYCKAMGKDFSLIATYENSFTL